MDSNILTYKQYDNLETYLAEMEPHLLLEECKNTFFMLMIQRVIKEEKEGKQASHFCSAIWNTQQELVFALFLYSDTILYGSYLLNNQFEAVDRCLQEFLLQEKQKKLSWCHSFQPALSHIQEYLTNHSQLQFKLIDRAWAYQLKQINWTERSLELKSDPLIELKVADESFDFIHAWTDTFLDDTAKTGNMIRIPTSDLGIEDQLKAKSIFVLYHDNEPVCMAWSRRPTKNGIAISLVYTPKDKRGKGYAGCCVSMLTESMLKQYNYVTLFVDGEKDQKDNLYTKIGYKYIGIGGRLIVTNVEYQNLKH